MRKKAIKLARKMACWGGVGIALLGLLLVLGGVSTTVLDHVFWPTATATTAANANATNMTLAQSSSRPFSADGCASESCTATPPRFYVESNWETDTQCPAETTVGDFDSDLTVIVVEYTAPELEGVVTNTTPTPTDIDSDGSRASFAQGLSGIRRAVRGMFDALSELVEMLVEAIDEASEPYKEQAFEGAERFGDDVRGYIGEVPFVLLVMSFLKVSVEEGGERSGAAIEIQKYLNINLNNHHPQLAAFFKIRLLKISPPPPPTSTSSSSTSSSSTSTTTTTAAKKREKMALAQSLELLRLRFTAIFWIVILFNVMYIDAAEQLKGVQRMEATANYYKGRDSQRGRRTKSARNANWRGAQVQGQQFHRFLPTSCTTAGVATCFASASSGDALELAAGTLSSTDGIRSDTQLTLQNKYASITCNTDGGACVWQGATGKGVVYILNNGGTSTLSSIQIKDGDGSYGGGLYVQNSNVVLVLIAFIANAAASRGGAIYVKQTGSSSVTLHGCYFAGNTVISYEGPDVFNSQETVAINTCPAGYAATQGSALSNGNTGGSTTSPAYSYSCLKECPAGEFSVYGPGFCTDACPVGSYISGDQACTSCPESSSTASTGSASIDQCVCNVGFYAGESSCVSCGSGTTAAVGTLILEQVRHAQPLNY